MKPNRFFMYKDLLDETEDFTYEQMGELLHMILLYQNGYKCETEDKIIKCIFKSLVKTFERDLQKYNEAIEENEKRF